MTTREVAEKSRARYEAGYPARTEHEAHVYDLLRESDERVARMAEVEMEEAALGRWPQNEATAYDLGMTSDPVAGAVPAAEYQRQAEAAREEREYDAAYAAYIETLEAASTAEPAPEAEL